MRRSIKKNAKKSKAPRSRPGQTVLVQVGRGEAWQPGATRSARATSMRLAFFFGARKKRVLLMADVMIMDSGLPGATPTIVITVAEAARKNVTAHVDNVRTADIATEKKEAEAKK